MTIKDFALASLKAGINVIPVRQDKTPKINWNFLNDRLMTVEEVDKFFDEDTMIGWIGGSISSGDAKTMVMIDVDQKYSLDGKLMRTYWDAIPEDLRKRLLVAETQNGGYHIIARSPNTPEGAQKLANRPTTPDEKNKTYLTYIEQGKTKAEARKLAGNDKVRVLIETRESRGYILTYPSPGYKFIKGTLNTITGEEHDFLLEAARNLNTYIKPAYEVPKVALENKMIVKEDSPFKAYNERGDVLGLLQTNGWSVVGGFGTIIHLKRPGNSKTAKSADFFTDRKSLVVYSTSTVFDNNTALQPSNVFCELECNGNWSLAAEKLEKMGYGKPRYHKLGRYSRRMKGVLEEIVSILDIPVDDDILKNKDKIIAKIKELQT